MYGPQMLFSRGLKCVLEVSHTLKMSLPPSWREPERGEASSSSCCYLWLFSSRVPGQSFSVLLHSIQTLVLEHRARGQLSHSPSSPLALTGSYKTSLAGGIFQANQLSVSSKYLSPRFKERQSQFALKQRTQILIIKILKIYMLSNIRMKFQGGFKHVL